MKEINKLFKSKLNINEHTKLIVSVSGGVDSMVLLDILNHLGYNLVVVNFNHQKRSDSEIDKKNVFDYCKKNGIVFEYIKLSITGADFQEKAHDKRKYHLENIAHKYGTNLIITAHHADDLLETILMKFVRGSNIYGYAGMQEITYHKEFIYVKPLLYYSKEFIMDYAYKNNTLYQEDSSNYSDEYTRNRFRHHIIPLLKSENPNILETAISYQKQLTDAFDLIRFSSLKYMKENVVHNTREFLKLEKAVQSDCMSLLLEENDIKPSFKIIEKLLKIIKSDKPNMTYTLSSALLFEKNYDIFAIKPSKKAINYDVIVDFDRQITLDTLIITFFNKIGVSLRDYIRVCYNELAFPLHIRNRKSGDVLELTFGHKKLKSFLIDKKIPKPVRDNLPVITDNNDRIIYIPNIYVNKSLGNKNEFYIVLKEK